MPFNEIVAIKVLNLDNHDTRVLVPPSLPAPTVLSVAPGGLGGLGECVLRTTVVVVAHIAYFSACRIYVSSQAPPLGRVRG